MWALEWCTSKRVIEKNLKSESISTIGFPLSDPLVVWNATPLGRYAWAYSDTREPVKVPRMAVS